MYLPPIVLRAFTVYVVSHFCTVLDNDTENSLKQSVLEQVVRKIKELFHLPVLPEWAKFGIVLRPILSLDFALLRPIAVPSGKPDAVFYGKTRSRRRAEEIQAFFIGQISAFDPEGGSEAAPAIRI